MNTLTSSTQRAQELNLKQFQIRKKAKLCVCCVFIVQLILRLFMIFLDASLTPKAALVVQISLPFCVLIPSTIALEYFLFKKKGPKVARYSNIMDAILLLCFTADWLTCIIGSLFRTQQSDPPTWRISTLFGFTAFSWRTLLVTLLVQKWQLKIIAPILATLLTTAYTVYYCQHHLTFLLIRCAVQLFNIIIIVYFEDKVKWMLVRTNLEQEKWMQVNNFILDSIPENIMILDLSGEAKFMSEYCKSFLKKYGFEVGEFFQGVQDLQQQQYEAGLPNSSENVLEIERLATCNGLLFTDNEQNFLKVEDLKSLIANFAVIIKDKNLQERQFLVYNGKLKMMENSLPHKSIEIKISFVQHYANDYIVLIFRDTTQRDLLVTLEETNKYKDQLLASVSHELRAPLNGTINLVESALQSKQIPEKIKESLLIPALRSSKFLLHIINDILDMSQIQQKKFRLAFQSGDLIETLKNTAQLVELQATKKGIELMLEFDPKLPEDFCTDHLRLSQIVLNLLTNAIKFTREGTVKLVAVLIIETKNVKISIEDSGIGISKENLKKLFSNYTIIDFEEREKMNPTGVGLGLNIASHLVQLLAPEGEKNINVTSIPNQGSNFSFILENKVESPLRPIEDVEKSCEVADELVNRIQPRFSKKLLHSSVSLSSMSDVLLKKACSCPRVLIVDDNPFNTMALETILSSLEVKCESVYSGSACIKSLLDRQSKVCGVGCQQYGVVFMDQEMPEMNGTETVKEIKRLQGEDMVSRAIRIIGCTAHKAKEEVEKFLAAGLDHCIYKPVSLVMIKDILKEFV